MYLDHNRKLLFVHIPKTGGSVIVSLMKQSKNNELLKGTHLGIELEDYKKYKDYYKFTIVRNSWEIWASAYRHRKLIGKYVDGKECTFDYFIDNYPAICTQLNYVRPEASILVDRIFYYSELWIICRDRFNTIIPEPKEENHFYGRYKYQDMYTENTKYKVYKKCKEDIDYFGFKFGE